MLVRVNILVIFILCHTPILSQKIIHGSIKDNQNEPIVGANIYFKKTPSKGTSSDVEGKFSLPIDNLKNRTLIISFITYKTKEIPLSNVDYHKAIIVVMEENDQLLNEIVVIGKDPISEKFSVSKVSKLDIYFNPVSKGDPLRAIAILPSSTNTDETASPTLRGGTADRSRVYINGSPILNPVRNTQQNGLGNFSLLNTQLIDKQYVYASNPPLTYGNSSAGIVEIETAKKLDVENIQTSLGLANIGLMVNKKITKKVFFQLYGNYKFSDFLITLNEKTIPNLNGFSLQDAGLHFSANITKNISFNSFSYFINESYKSTNHSLNFKGESHAQQKRFFTINNVNYNKGKSNIRLSTAFDRNNKSYSFGIINSKSASKNIYVSFNHRYEINKQLSFQYGYNFYYVHYDYEERSPLHYYAIDKQSPYRNNIEKTTFNYSELYSYVDYKINSDLGVSGAIRKNIFPHDSIASFISYQLSAFYNINNKNRFILGLGNYYSYSTPNYYFHSISLLNSKQISLDYYRDTRKYSIASAVYYKLDKGDINTNFIKNFDKIQSLGVEASFTYHINKYLSIGISNTFLRQDGYLNQIRYNTPNNLRYYIKSQLIYNNPKYVNASLAFSTRPGSYYTKVSDAFFNTKSNNYEPVFREVNTYTYNDYYGLDFTINKMFSVLKNPLIVYLSISNILNRKNQSNVYYNTNYSTPLYNNYPQRVIYFGVIYRFNHTFKQSSD